MAVDPNQDPATPEFAEEFASFSSALTLDGMPVEVVDLVKRDLFDTLACAVAGYSAAGVSELTALVSGWGGAGEAAIWGAGLRVPAHHAAWVNGMMSHARDFDDTHDGAILHAGVSVVPAALAAADMDRSASGGDLLAGIAAGLELICRLGVATTIGIIDSGYMYTSLFGHFAATAAAARVLRLDAAQTVNALGIAYSQAAGTHQVTRDAALTKRIQPGFAAKTGLISVAMAKAGILGARRTFEGTDGLFRSYLRGHYSPEVLRGRLGERFHQLDLSFKPYPCCRFNHTAIDAALELRDRIGPADSIRRIVAHVNIQAREAVGTPLAMRRRPQTVVQAQFSIPYTVAVAILKGNVGIGDFVPDALADEAVVDLASRVDVEVDPDIERDWGRGVSPTRLAVESGRGVFEARIDYPLGHAARPMDRVDFDRKLRGAIEISGLDWPDSDARKLRDLVDGLETLPVAGVIADLMARRA